MSDVQAAAPRPLARPRPPDPETDVRLARVHLRMGLLGLARAELEALAGSDRLDRDGLAALAEARWRTGDLTGAGDAAQAYLRDGGDSVVALVVAAEAVAALGRPGEARRIAAQALERGDLPLDRIFSGMPRSAIWPADPAQVGGPAAAGSPAGELFPDPAGGQAVASFEAAEAAAGAAAAAAATADDPAAPGLWGTGAAERPLPDGRAALAAAEAAIGSGRAETAAVHLAIVLRTAPELAPAVLDATTRAAGALRGPSPELELVRGDAYRLVGHESDARRCWAAAAAALEARGRGAPDR